MHSDKDITIISNYFPPESGAAANRISTMATALEKEGYNVTLVCPLPNYPFGSIFSEYKNRFIHKSLENNITIYRLWLFASNSKNKVIRLFSMLSFSISLFIFLLFKKTSKNVIIQCSPLFVGFFGVLISKIKRKKIILNVSDIWPLAGLEMGLLKKGRYYTILERIELFNYKNADLLLGQSEEILSHFKALTPNKNYFLYRNFPDFEIPQLKNNSEGKTIKIVYAGLLGIAQGIYNLCQELELPHNVELHIYGNGPEADLITDFCSSKTNIFYHGSIERKDLHKKLIEFDITIIPLIKRIYGSVPSKIFEYSRLGLPILYYSDGEGYDLVQRHNLGFAYNSNDIDGINQFLNDLSNSTITLPKKRDIIKTVEESFDFNDQFQSFIEKIKTL